MALRWPLYACGCHETQVVKVSDGLINLGSMYLPVTEIQIWMILFMSACSLKWQGTGG